MSLLITTYNVLKYEQSNFLPVFGRLKKNIILNKISIKIYENEIISLIGESGYGKTLFAKVLTGLVDLDGGKIFYKDKEIKNFSQKDLRKKLQMVFQNPQETLNLKMTAYQLIEEPLIFYKVSDKNLSYDKKIRELAKELFFPLNNLHTQAEDLSLLDFKKIMLARVLAIEPEFIVIDDIISDLDEIGRNIIKNLILKIRNERKISIMLISNNLDILIEISDRFVIMYQGNLIEVIPKNRSEYIKKKDTDKLKIHPYTALLFENIENYKNIEDYLKKIQTKRKGVAGRCVYLNRCNYVSDICYKQKCVLKEIDDGHFVSCLKVEHS